MCIAPLIKTGGATFYRTSNSFRSWARNLGRLTSIMDLSSRVSSFSSGKVSCSAAKPEERGGGGEKNDVMKKKQLESLSE